MANYEGWARSNYVLVKDIEAFCKAMEPYPVSVEIEYPTAQVKRVALLSASDEGGWDWVRNHDDEFEDEQEDPSILIGPHLQDGEVMVLMEVGHEKMRYLIGVALAFNNAGETAVVNLDDIYGHAQEIAGLSTIVGTAAY